MGCASPKWFGTYQGTSFIHQSLKVGLNVPKRSIQINNRILLFSYFYPIKANHAQAKQLGNNTLTFLLSRNIWTLSFIHQTLKVGFRVSKLQFRLLLLPN